MAGRWLQPTRTTFAVILGLAWSLTVGAARDFVWEDLKSGMLRLDGLDRSTRALVWLGFGLLFAATGALLFGDLWRSIFDLLPATAGTPGRGSLFPSAAIPTTFFLLTVAWAFVLAGALHSHWLIRLGALGIYLLIAGLWLRGSLISTNVWTNIAGGWAPVAGVLLLFFLRRRRPARQPAEFLLLFVLLAISFATVQSRLLTTWRFSGTPLFLSILDSNILTYSSLAMPLLLLIGLDIADFVHRSAGWVTEAVSTRLGRWGATVGLVGGLAWWLRAMIGDALDLLASRPVPVVLAGLFSASVGPLLTLVIWWFLGRRQADRQAALRPEEVSDAAHANGPWFIVAFWVANYALIVVSVLVLALGSRLATVTQLLGDLDSFATRHQRNLMFYILLGTLGVALWAAWRKRRAQAVYLTTLSAILLWGDMTAVGRPLARFTWQGPEVAFWWFAFCVIVGLVWLLRGQLTPARASRLLLLVLINLLLRQTDFIENPLSPFFGFAGIAFVAFGLLWDALTVGSWANRGTPGLPRVSRIFLYLGYVLFTITIVNWMVMSHNLFYVDTFTGEAALGGLKLVGKPMLYALFPVILAQAETTPP